MDDEALDKYKKLYGDIEQSRKIFNDIKNALREKFEGGEYYAYIKIPLLGDKRVPYIKWLIRNDFEVWWDDDDDMISVNWIDPPNNKSIAKIYNGFSTNNSYKSNNN